MAENYIKSKIIDSEVAEHLNYADAVADMGTADLLIDAHHRNAADGLGAVFLQNDGPVVKIRFRVVAGPVGQHPAADLRAGVGGPGQVLCDLVITGPVAEHGRGVVHGEGPEDQTRGFDDLGTLVVKHDVFTPFG